MGEALYKDETEKPDIKRKKHVVSISEGISLFGKTRQNTTVVRKTRSIKVHKTPAPQEHEQNVDVESHAKKQKKSGIVKSNGFSFANLSSLIGSAKPKKEKPSLNDHAVPSIKVRRKINAQLLPFIIPSA
ncbi:MAG: hypothetical protein HQM12_10680 [SAR324 cluster bacterium]|nr:hypothetical protein [SAR324 cluster bacterium]